MTVNSANSELVREFFAAINAGDGEALANALSENATWTIFGTLPVSGIHEGREAIMTDLLPKAGAAFEPGSLNLEITNLVSNDDSVIVECTGRGRSVDGKTYHNFYAFALTINGGKITAIREYCDTEKVRAVLFS